MDKNNKKTVLIISAVIVILVIVITCIALNNKTIEDVPIILREELDKNETVKNLDIVRWSNASIRQSDNKLRMTVYLTNQSETEVVPERDLKVNLLDEKGKTVISQDVHMEEIESNYGHVTIKIEADMDEVVLIRDIEIIAK